MYDYFDDIINTNDLDLDITLLNEKTHENILICDVSYKNPYGAKLLHIIFDKVGGYIREHDRTKYLGLFYSDEKYEIIFDRIRYLIMIKCKISDVY